MLLYVFLSVCVYAYVQVLYSRIIAIFELMFLLTKPTLNNVYFTLLHFTLSRATLKFDRWPWKTIGRPFYAT